MKNLGSIYSFLHNLFIFKKKILKFNFTFTKT